VFCSVSLTVLVWLLGSSGRTHTSPAAVAIAATLAEEGELVGEIGGFGPVDGVGVGILLDERGGALAVAHQRALEKVGVSVEMGPSAEVSGQDSP
jgi:hypothetical protein